MGWALPQSGFWQWKGNFRPFRFLAFVHPESRHWGSKSIIRGLFRIEICDLTDCNLSVSTNTMKPLTSPLSLGMHGLLKVSHLLSHLGSHYISWEGRVYGMENSTSTHLKMVHLINSCTPSLKINHLEFKFDLSFPHYLSAECSEPQGQVSNPIIGNGILCARWIKATRQHIPILKVKAL